MSPSAPHRPASAPEPARGVAPARRALRVLTWNLAHGRANGAHQLLQSPGSRRAALRRIAGVLARERPEVVGLQEVDGPCFWSGGFCHLRHLAELGGFPFSAHTEHVSRRWLRYGTALLSARELLDPRGITFTRIPLSFSKGFTIASVRSAAGRDVDVVSVHLDFARLAVRRRQVDEMVAALSPRRRPLVLMGDLNAGWNEESSAVRALAERLGLVTYEPDAPPRAEGVQTFPASRARLDWVLVSSDLDFARYEVLPDVVSDHLPVIADVRWR